jgi:hypothetical protein
MSPSEISASAIFAHFEQRNYLLLLTWRRFCEYWGNELLWQLERVHPHDVWDPDALDVVAHNLAEVVASRLHSRHAEPRSRGAQIGHHHARAVRRLDLFKQDYSSIICHKRSVPKY